MSVHSSSSRGLQVDMSMFTVVGSAYLAYIPRGVMERLKMYLKHKLGHEQRLPRWSVSRGDRQRASDVEGAGQC